MPVPASRSRRDVEKFGTDPFENVENGYCGRKEVGRLERYGFEYWFIGR